MKLIVGLGNPGKVYRRTRHNVGWLVLDFLARDISWTTSKKARADYLKTKIGPAEAELLKPADYMNNSGLAVAYAVKKHNLSPEEVVVVHDDKDIPFGEIKVQKDRSAAGHNGVQSIINHLGTKNFWRVRVGIGVTRNIGDTADFVLNRFSKTEEKNLPDIVARAAEEVANIITG